MPAYVIADIQVHDPDTYEDYKARVQAALDPFEGRFLVRGGATETLEGDWDPERVVIIQFPSADHARRWHASPDYAEALKIRQRASTGSLILAEGYEP
jgi:uncharacterized protein (DUF1330 family)